MQEEEMARTERGTFYQRRRAKEAVNVKTISLIASGACGALVLGLEVRTTSGNSMCNVNVSLPWIPAGQNQLQQRTLFVDLETKIFGAGKVNRRRHAGPHPQVGRPVHRSGLLIFQLLNGGSASNSLYVCRQQRQEVQAGVRHLTGPASL